MDHSCYNEEELLLLLADGNEQAFTTLYNQYWKKLYFLAHKHLRSPQAAEEIVQDVFYALWKSRHNRQIHSLPVYLAAMTRYSVYRYIAMERKHPWTEMTESSGTQMQVSQEPLLENRLLVGIIENLSNQLPEKCRLVFTYNKLLDVPLKEVAREMNISTKTAEAHLTKALKLIRGNLKDAMSIFLFL